MQSYGRNFSLKRKVSQNRKIFFKDISLINLKLFHKIFNTINFSLLVLIFIFSFISFNSQRKWSNTYKLLSQTRGFNNNLIDYISKTEEFYISELVSLNTFKKTRPKDLRYFEKIISKRENLFIKKISKIIKGLKDSQYLTGY